MIWKSILLSGHGLCILFAPCADCQVLLPAARVDCTQLVLANPALYSLRQRQPLACRALPLGLLSLNMLPLGAAYLIRKSCHPSFLEQSFVAAKAHAFNLIVVVGIHFQEIWTV